MLSRVLLVSRKDINKHSTVGLLTPEYILDLYSFKLHACVLSLTQESIFFSIDIIHLFLTAMSTDRSQFPESSSAILFSETYIQRVRISCPLFCVSLRVYLNGECSTEMLEDSGVYTLSTTPGFPQQGLCH